MSTSMTYIQSYFDIKKAAIDHDYQTYWHPSNNENTIFFNITLNTPANIKRIDLYQRKWSSGYATKVM